MLGMRVVMQTNLVTDASLSLKDASFILEKQSPVNLLNGGWYADVPVQLMVLQGGGTLMCR